MSLSKLLLLVLPIAGCGDGSLVIRQIQDLDRDCSVPKDQGAPSHSEGTLDVAFRADYVLTPLIENDGPETRVEGAIVRIHDSADPDVPLEETSPVLVFYSYAETTLGSGELGTVNLTVVPSEYAASRHDDLCGDDPNRFEPRQDLVLVEVLLEGSNSESARMLFPVTLCCGCLVDCPPEADHSAEPGFDCCSNAPVEDESCQPGQDALVDCRMCRGDSDLLLATLCSCGYEGICPAE